MTCKSMLFLFTGSNTAHFIISTGIMFYTTHQWLPILFSMMYGFVFLPSVALIHYQTISWKIGACLLSCCCITFVGSFVLNTFIYKYSFDNCVIYIAAFMHGFAFPPFVYSFYNLIKDGNTPYTARCKLNIMETVV